MVLALAPVSVAGTCDPQQQILDLIASKMGPRSEPTVSTAPHRLPPAFSAPDVLQTRLDSNGRLIASSLRLIASTQRLIDSIQQLVDGFHSDPPPVDHSAVRRLCFCGGPAKQRRTVEVFETATEGLQSIGCAIEEAVLNYKACRARLEETQIDLNKSSKKLEDLMKQQLKLLQRVRVSTRGGLEG